MSAEALQEVVSKVLSTLWSTASFQALYGRLSDWTPGSDDAQPTMMDRWALSRTHATVRDVDAALERFDSPDCWPTDRRADRRPLELVRPAFQTAVLGGRTGRAADTAHLPAQRGAHDGGFTPFITERLWQDLSQTLKGGKRPPGVVAAGGRVSDRRAAREPMALVRRLVELGRGPRGVRHEDPAAAVPCAGGSCGLGRVGRTCARAQIAEELNVESLESPG